jgi:hypothetical protein
MALNVKDEVELQDLDVRDMATSFVAVQARQWQRRTVNRLLEEIKPQLEDARRDGNRPDTIALLRAAWLDLGFRGLLESSDEAPDR